MMKTRLSQIFAAALVGVLLLGEITPAKAFDGRSQREAQNRGRDQAPSLVTPLVPRVPADPTRRGRGQARDAVQRGEIRPLEEVTARVQQRYPGRLLDAQLRQARGRWIYHLKMLTRDGRVLRVAVDARTAQILGIAGRKR
jgi:hypothetical protein